MSSSVLVFGANGYIGLGIALGLRRSGFHVYGVIRNSRHSALLVQNEIEPVVVESFDKVDAFADQLTKCSVVVDAVGFRESLSEILLQAVINAAKQRTQDGKIPHYAPLFIFTSGIMTCELTTLRFLNRN
jgi:NAD(P)-dependent dehydrogenase (short-subunit alcohol dehydrogenase family)